MSAFHDNALMGASGSQGYQISRSVRLRSSASAYFTRTPSSAGSQTTWTWSSWVKRGQLGSFQDLFHAYPGSGQRSQILFRDTDTLYIELESANTNNLTTTQVFRDASAWYHIVVVYDSNNATSGDRVRLYVNGSRVTSFSVATYPSSGSQSVINSTTQHEISSYDGAGYYFDGYLTEVNFIDGQALTPSSFGETDTITGVWKPKKYAGTYGTNGFYLNFSDNSNNTATTIGKDYSGNGNNWTPNNISVTSGVTYDSMLDVPTMWADGGNGRGNYAVLASNAPGIGTISAANLQYTSGTTTVYSAISTISVDSGKWYWEVTATAVNGTNFYPFIGAYRGIPNTLTGAVRPGADTGINGFSLRQDGTFRVDGTNTQTISSFTTNDVLGIALDLTNLEVKFYKNGTLVLTQTGLTAGTYTPADSEYNGSSVAYNFGQRPFAYTPPSGFKALNTQNLPEPTIKNGNQYFDVSTWTGTNSTGARSITSLAFQPDFVWSKIRSNAFSNQLYDSVRGTGKSLISNSTAAEDTTNISGYISSFDSNGFSTTPGSSDNWYWNYLNGTFVAWSWKKGATQGFDIVTYTGDGTTSSTRTISHSLGVTPEFIITKKRSGGTDYGWSCWHKDLGGNYGIWLDKTSARNPGMWAGYSNFSSTVFTPPDLSYGNENGATYVNYLFSEVAGFSKFGSYTGNGSADGPFVFCGFRPAFVMLKRTDTTGIWYIWDNKRIIQANGDAGVLQPQASDAEADYNAAGIDMLSNGFKIRNTDASDNGSGSTIIYAAFAENPLKFSLAR